MNKESNNIYKNARIRAGLRREPAAEELHIDVRTLDKYEAFGGRAPDEIVKKMCELYADKYLAYLHIKKSPFLNTPNCSTLWIAVLQRNSLSTTDGLIVWILKRLYLFPKKVTSWICIERNTTRCFLIKLPVLMPLFCNFSEPYQCNGYEQGIR